MLTEIRSALRSQRIKPKMGKLNLDFDSALRQTSLFGSPEDNVVPDEVRERVQNVTQNVSLEPFRRDKTLKAIASQYKDTHDQNQLVAALDVFFIENYLYREVTLPRATLEEIHEEDLRLIAYEVFK